MPESGKDAEGGETMQPDPNRYDDDPDDDLEEQADEGDAADAWADDEATAAPVSGYKTLGGALGAALDNLEKTLAGKGIDISHIPERRDMEEEKPEPLPLVDEEELAAIKDPRERARQRYNKECLYRNHPYALQRSKERSAELIAERKKLLHLPVIPQETRPTVNVIANSALFAAVQGKDRQLLNDAHLDTQDGVQIIFSGEQFNQDDHDVLMQLVFAASRYELGTPVTVSAHSLLKALGRGTSGKEHNQLKAEIKRLVKGTINLKTKRFDYVGHLIDDAQQDKKTKFWTYRANPTLGKFYDVGNYTLIDWEERKALKGKDLARWVQLQLSTHARPFPMKIETIRRLSGSKNKQKSDFKRKLQTALNDLKALGIIAEWRIDAGDLVHVDRGDATSASQQRHLAKPAARRRLPKPQD
mgnify:CR=1 FL=1